MKAFWMSATGQLSVGLVLVAAVVVAFAVGGDATFGLVCAALVLAFLVVVYFGRRRSDTLDVMSGIGDERAKLLYTRAVAFSGTVMSFVLPSWWLVTVAQGDPDEVLSVCCAIFGATFVFAVVVLARRG
jgi:archaellum biogenesis protein FlaJ (TadC family)